MSLTRTAQSVVAAGVVVIALAVAAARFWAPAPDSTSSSTASAVPSHANPAGTTPSSTSPPTEPSAAELELTDGGDPDRPHSVEPTNNPTDHGSDTHHDELPAGENDRLVRRAAQFWAAFSLRSPRDRKAAVAEVTVPYLAEQMAVDRTDRIPVLQVRRTAVLSSSFTSALTVSQMTSGGWWYVVFVYDPDHETWMAQEYEQAPPGMVSDAKAVLHRGTGRR